MSKPNKGVSPPASKTIHSGFREFLFEFFKTAQLSINGCCQRTTRLPSALWTDHFPEQRMIGMSASVISDSSPDIVGYKLQLLQESINTLVLKLGIFTQRCV